MSIKAIAAAASSKAKNIRLPKKAAASHPILAAAKMHSQPAADTVKLSHKK